MPVRRGHVAPQNTFLGVIIRKFEGQSEYNVHRCLAFLSVTMHVDCWGLDPPPHQIHLKSVIFINLFWGPCKDNCADILSCNNHVVVCPSRNGNFPQLFKKRGISEIPSLSSPLPSFLQSCSVFKDYSQRCVAAWSNRNPFNKTSVCATNVFLVLNIWEIIVICG